MNKFKKSKQN